MVRMRWCSLSPFTALSEGFILNACVSVGGGLLDNCIVKILPGPALSLLQMLNVHLAHYIQCIQSFTLLKNKCSYNLECLEAALHYTLVSFCLKFSAPLLIFGKSENKLLLLCLDNIPKTCTVDHVSSNSWVPVLSQSVTVASQLRGSSS